MYFIFCISIVVLLGSGHAIRLTSLPEQDVQANLGYLRPSQYGIKRAGESSYIRFGKRRSPDSAEFGFRTSEFPEEDPKEYPQRLEKVMGNLPQRFRYPLDEKCLSRALKEARNISHFHMLLVKNGCWDVAKRTTSKKDGYIRFGKRSMEEPSEYFDDGYEISN